MSNEQLIAQLRNELRGIKPLLPDDLAATDNFRNDWNLDSLELVEFVARIEQQYSILIPDEDLAELVSLQASAKYLQAKLTN
ncbi:MAG: acyl carrier protein [Saprospiraceae bacterium]